MSWKAPRTWVAGGETVTRAKINKNIEDNLPPIEHCTHSDGYYYGPPPEPPAPEVPITAALLGAAAMAVDLKKPVQRRSLLFPWLRRNKE
jgi:hypothetical protein